MLTPVVFEEAHLTFIKLKMQDENFTHNSWSDDDLQEIKDRIKSHYHAVQNTVCPYCKRQLDSRNGRNWDIEHIISRSSVSNFMFEPKNICMACVDCNTEKSDKTVTTSKAKSHYPSRSEQFLIIHPHYDEYDDFLLAIEPGLFYFPRHPKGRKTIEICGLNRFYEYAGFGKDSNILEKIRLLTEIAEKASNAQIKGEILSQITALALKGVIQNQHRAASV